MINRAIPTSENTPEEVTFDNIPEEVVAAEILSRLQPGVLKKASLINKNLYQLASSNLLWKPHFEDQYPEEIPTEPNLLLHKEFARQRRISFNILSPVQNKLLYLIEENDLDQIKTLLASTNLTITTLLHFYGFDIITAINNQDNQILRNFFFDRVYKEYTSIVATNANPHHHRITRALYDKFHKSNALNQPGTSILSEVLKITDKNKLTLFHWACLFGQLNLLQQPEMMAINPNELIVVHVGNQHSALQYCAATNALDGMEYLIARGADIDAQILNDSAFQLSMRLGREAAVKLLLSKGAKPGLIDRGTLRLDITISEAARCGSTFMLKICLEQYAEQLTAQDIINATHTALHENNYYAFLFLYPYAIKQGITANDLMTYIVFPFNSSKKYSSCLRFLLEKGGSPETKDLLIRAISDGNLRAVKVLLDYHTIIPLDSNENNNAIFCAAKATCGMYRFCPLEVRIQMLKLLIESDPAIVDKPGFAFAIKELTEFKVTNLEPASYPGYREADPEFKELQAILDFLNEQVRKVEKADFSFNR